MNIYQESTRLNWCWVSIFLTVTTQFFAPSSFASISCQTIFRSPVKSISQILNVEDAQNIAAETKNFKEFTLSLLWLRNNGQSAVAKGLFKSRGPNFTQEDRDRITNILFRIAPQVSFDLKYERGLSPTSYRDENDQTRPQPQFWSQLSPRENWLISSFQLTGKYDMARMTERNPEWQMAIRSGKTSELYAKIKRDNEKIDKRNFTATSGAYRLLKVSREMFSSYPINFVLDVSKGQESEVAYNERWVWGLQRLGIPTRLLYLVDQAHSVNGQTGLFEIDAKSGDRKPVTFSEELGADRPPIFFMNDGQTPPVPAPVFDGFAKNPLVWLSSKMPKFWNLEQKYEKNGLVSEPIPAPIFDGFAKNRLVWVSSKMPKFWNLEQKYEKNGLVSESIYREPGLLAAVLEKFRTGKYGDLTLSHRQWNFDPAFIEQAQPLTAEDQQKTLTRLKYSIGENVYYIFCRLVLFDIEGIEGVIEQALLYHRILEPKISDDRLGYYMPQHVGTLLQLPWVKTGNYPQWMKDAIKAGPDYILPEVSTP